MIPGWDFVTLLDWASLPLFPVFIQSATFMKHLSRAQIERVIWWWAHETASSFHWNWISVLFPYIHIFETATLYTRVFLYFGLFVCKNQLDFNWLRSERSPPSHVSTKRDFYRALTKWGVISQPVVKERLLQENCPVGHFLQFVWQGMHNWQITRNLEHFPFLIK